MELKTNEVKRREELGTREREEKQTREEKQKKEKPKEAKRMRGEETNMRRITPRRCPAALLANSPFS